MLIDSHVHVWASDPQNYPWQPILAHVPPPANPAPVEMLLDDMDRAGVDMAVLVQPSVYGWDNRYLINCLDAWPGRFIGLCLIDPRSPVPREDLLRLCGPGRCRGLRLNTIRQGDISWLAAPDRHALFAALAELGLSLSFHMDIEQAPVVATLSARYPGVPFIIDYLGPDIHRNTGAAAHLDLLAVRPNIHFKLLCVAEDEDTSPPFPDILPFYQQVLARFGARRVMFGSDYPGARTVCAYEEIIAWGTSFPGLTGDERRQVMGGTAARIFAIDCPRAEAD